jgi:hypothetical protein
MGGGCTTLRAGGAQSRRMDIIGPALLRIELTQMQLCHDLVLNTPRLVSLSISNPSRELELDDALVACTMLEELTVRDAVRPLRNLSGVLSSLQGLRSVRFSSCTLGSLRLTGGEQLASLTLESCEQTREVLLSDCAQLREVRLDYSSVRVLEITECPSLASLGVAGCSFDDFVVRCPALVELSGLSPLWAPPPDEGRLEVTCPSLAHLAISRSRALRDVHLTPVLAVCERLTVLSLFDCHKVTEVRAPSTLVELSLRSLRSLTRVVAPDGSKAALPTLARLSLSNVPKLSDADRNGLIASVAPTLSTLELTLLGTETTSLSLGHLPALVSLSIE